jgi:Ca2+/Na+ antiporter
MIHWLSNLVGAAAALGLMVAGFAYMLSPKQGGELLKRVAVFLAGALVGLCLLQQFTACLGLVSFLLLAVVLSFAAYLFLEFRRSRSPQRPPRRHGAERKPILPRGG